MIRRGRTEGWLTLSGEAFRSWADLNDVTFDGTQPGVAPGRGAALIASAAHDAESDDSNALLTVPRDLILSLEKCQEHARVDRDYREVLESLGDFGRTPRGAILSFLLVQASMLCPQLSEYVGVHTIFLQYIKSLPMEMLPTFWTEPEVELLVGTTLAPAMSAKIKSLRREYDILCSSGSNTRWFKAVEEHLEFDDWLQVDAMYRSRALDIPALGHCMIPCVDLANHASGDATVALYEKDANGDAVLLLRDGKKLAGGDEVTITYGDEKGACEMIFSYGFLEAGMESAQSLFLSLSLLDHDALSLAKRDFADCAPGFKLIDTGDDGIDWSGDFIWLLCVTEEDGFRFEIARTIDGDTETQAFFQEQQLTGGAGELYNLLTKHELWDVFRLRAITLLQQRVFDQLQVLYSTQDEMEDVPRGEGIDIRDGPYHLAMRLRNLEFELMNRAYESFEQKKIELADTPVITRYLGDMCNDKPAQIATASELQPVGSVADDRQEDEDFS